MASPANQAQSSAGGDAAERLLYISSRAQERRPGQSVLLAKPFRLDALVPSVERVLIPRTVH